MHLAKKGVDLVSQFFKSLESLNLNIEYARIFSSFCPHFCESVEKQYFATIFFHCTIGFIALLLPIAMAINCVINSKTTHTHAEDAVVAVESELVLVRSH